VVSVVPVACVGEALSALHRGLTQNAKRLKKCNFIEGRRERVPVQLTTFTSPAARSSNRKKSGSQFLSDLGIG
jgi:MoxR-like ATPase